MADSAIRIEGLHPAIDGDYPINPGGFTNRDYHDIKRIAKVRSQEIQEAFEQGDMDLFVAFAVIALRHAGKNVAEDALWDAPIGKITFLAGDEEAVEDRPPALAPSNGTPSAPVGGERQSDPSEPSGSPSRNGVDAPESDPSPIGTPLSDTGATSPFVTSAS